MKMIVILAIGVLIVTAAAQNPKNFDKNGNGKIDVGDESEAFLKHVNSTLFAKIDTNFDGVISDDELKKYQKDLDIAIAPDVVDLEDLFGPRGALTFEQSTDYLRERKRSSTFTSWPENLFVRRKFIDAALASSAEEKFKSDEGALFSYTRDFEENNDIWRATGAVMYRIGGPTGAVPDPKVTSLIDYYFMPSISFDRVTNDKHPEKEVDELTFRNSFTMTLQGGDVFDVQTLTASLRYGTDFDFESEQFAGELDYAPYKKLWALGVSQNLGTVVEFRFAANFHLEGGYVADAGSKTNLDEDHGFFRIGPQVGLEIWPAPDFFDRRLTLAIKYGFLSGLAGDPGWTDLIEASLRYKIDDGGHFSFEINYRVGEVQPTFDAVDQLSIALGVKF